jgi:hypothetical protein
MEHDRLFKRLFSVFWPHLLTDFFAALAAYLNPDSCLFLDKQVFAEAGLDDAREVDLLIQARVQESDAFFLIHIEHQSARQPDFPRRMFRYFTRLHESHNKPVYPIVVFSHDAPSAPEPATYEVVFPDKRVLTFEYTVLQLNRLSWRDYVNRPSPAVAALMAKMQRAPGEGWQVKLACMRMLLGLGLEPSQRRLVAQFVDR